MIFTEEIVVLVEIRVVEVVVVSFVVVVDVFVVLVVVVIVVVLVAVVVVIVVVVVVVVVVVPVFFVIVVVDEFDEVFRSSSLSTCCFEILRISLTIISDTLEVSSLMLTVSASLLELICKFANSIIPLTSLLRLGSMVL